MNGFGESAPRSEGRWRSVVGNFLRRHRPRTVVARYVWAVGILAAIMTLPAVLAVLPAWMIGVGMIVLFAVLAIQVIAMLLEGWGDY